MPVYLRRFYYKKLSDVKKKEADEIKKSQQKQNQTISRPSYSNPRIKR